MMVLALELAAFCESDTYLKAMAGFCLVYIFGRMRRMRISDMTRMVHLSVIGAFAEGSLSHAHKDIQNEGETNHVSSSNFSLSRFFWNAMV